VRDTNPEESFGEATLVSDSVVELGRSLKLRQLPAVSLGGLTTPTDCAIALSSPLKVALS
jgi:hypothetical protein